ncbi:MAG TPA: hypothetical protein VF469_40400, partial [Kofleriaceae bacterium]
QAPELAMPLNRVEVVDAPHPYDMSTAWAAELPSLDGVWYPPRRFLDLLSALTGTAIAPTACVFQLSRSPAFPVLQQLYNIRYVVSVADRSIRAQPEALGAAWFPARVVTIDRPDEMAAALQGRGVHSTLAATAWLARTDAGRAPADPTACSDTVTGVTTDELGQTATITVTAPQACSLVVATNYVSTFRAIATVGGSTREVAVFPIDIALTGVAVPAGASTITLGPVADLPWWSRVASWLGIALLGAAIWQLGRPRVRA